MEVTAVIQTIQKAQKFKNPKEASQNDSSPSGVEKKTLKNITTPQR